MSWYILFPIVLLAFYLLIGVFLLSLYIVFTVRRGEFELSDLLLLPVAAIVWLPCVLLAGMLHPELDEDAGRRYRLSVS